MQLPLFYTSLLILPILAFILQKCRCTEINQNINKGCSKHGLHCEKTAACVYSSQASSGPFGKKKYHRLTYGPASQCGQKTGQLSVRYRGKGGWHTSNLRTFHCQELLTHCFWVNTSSLRLLPRLQHVVMTDTTTFLSWYSRGNLSISPKTITAKMVTPSNNTAHALCKPPYRLPCFEIKANELSFYAQQVLFHAYKAFRPSHPKCTEAFTFF